MESSSQTLFEGAGTGFNFNSNYERILSDKYYVISARGYDFYSINVNEGDVHDLELIAAECKKVEDQCWNAQEDFFEYVKKRNLLTYIVKDREVIGFQICSYWTMEKYLIFDLDETMVLKKHRGHSLAKALSTISARTVYLRLTSIKELKKVVFMSITPNPKLMNILSNYRHLFKFFDNAFSPSKDLIRIHDKFVDSRNLTLVDKDYPFFMKSMFPGSQKPADKEFRFSRKISKMLPPGLDFNRRGDAFVFFAIASRLTASPVLFLLAMMNFGKKYIFNKTLGIFGRDKATSKRSGLDRRVHDELQNTVAVERRECDRRRVDCRKYSEKFSDRRIAQRRVSA